VNYEEGYTEKFGFFCRDECQSMIFQMKAVDQYFHVMLLPLHFFFQKQKLYKIFKFLLLFSNRGIMFASKISNIAIRFLSD